MYLVHRPLKFTAHQRRLSEGAISTAALPPSRPALRALCFGLGLPQQPNAMTGKEQAGVEDPDEAQAPQSRRGAEKMPYGSLLSTVGAMFQQHADLFSQQADELNIIVSRPADPASWPVGTSGIPSAATAIVNPRDESSLLFDRERVSTNEGSKDPHQTVRLLSRKLKSISRWNNTELEKLKSEERREQKQRYARHPNATRRYDYWCKVVGCEKHAQAKKDGMCIRHWTQLNMPQAPTDPKDVNSEPTRESTSDSEKQKKTLERQRGKRPRSDDEEKVDELHSTNSMNVREPALDGEINGSGQLDGDATKKKQKQSG